MDTRKRAGWPVGKSAFTMSFVRNHRRASACVSQCVPFLPVRKSVTVATADNWCFASRKLRRSSRETEVKAKFSFRSVDADGKPTLTAKPGMRARHGRFPQQMPGCLAHGEQNSPMSRDSSKLSSAPFQSFQGRRWKSSQNAASLNAPASLHSSRMQKELLPSQSTQSPC